MTDPRERHRGRHWRDRDTTQCPTCGNTTDELQVHHRDENPQNGHPENLRVRCPRCHFDGEHDRPDDVDRDHQPSPSRTSPPSPTTSWPL